MLCLLQYIFSLGLWNRSNDFQFFKILNTINVCELIHLISSISRNHVSGSLGLRWCTCGSSAIRGRIWATVPEHHRLSLGFWLTSGFLRFYCHVPRKEFWFLNALQWSLPLCEDLDHLIVFYTIRTSFCFPPVHSIRRFKDPSCHLGP